MVGHGAAHPLVAAVLLDVGDPLLTLTHDLRPLQVEVFVDHLAGREGLKGISAECGSEQLTTTCTAARHHQPPRPVKR